MNEHEEHNELIPRLAEHLRNHTEPYKEGAWEHFVTTYGKRRRRLWPYWGAAAVMLLAIGGYWLMRQPADSRLTPQLSQQEAERGAVVGSSVYDDEQPDGGTPPAVASTTTALVVRPADEVPTGVVDEVSAETGRPDGATQAPVGIPEALPEEAPVAATEMAVVAASADSVPATTPESQRLAVTAVEDVTGFEPPASGPPLDVALNTQKPSDSREKWDLGVVVSPSVTSETINIGGGLAVAYRVSDKISIGSGIAVAQLGVGENPNYQPHYVGRPSDQYASDPNTHFGGPYFNGKSEAALGYKREVSLTSSVVTLDIPLDVRYEVVKGFYTSVGVSYVAVLNERRTGHYIDKINVNTFANGHAGSADRLAPTEFVYSSERIPAKPLRGKGYAGFMNFSVGKKLPISTKLFLSVEPYFKLPIGRLSKEEMDFTNGGIRIVTGF